MAGPPKSKEPKEPTSENSEQLHTSCLPSFAPSLAVFLVHSLFSYLFLLYTYYFLIQLTQVQIVGRMQ